MLFTVLVHEAEEGGYWGECLQLPGCASQGESLDEMDANIREAIELVLEIKIEDGEDLSKMLRGEPTAPNDPNVRYWEINVPIPELAAAGDPAPG